MPNQPPLNPDALARAQKAYDRSKHMFSSDPLRDAIDIYLAVAQPVVDSVEELDALPHGTVIMATGGRWNPSHPELFLKCGYSHAPWLALDPSDRDDGENLESSGAVLRWRCDGEARVLYRPEVDDA